MTWWQLANKSLHAIERSRLALGASEQTLERLIQLRAFLSCLIGGPGKNGENGENGRGPDESTSRISG
jgi:hypothetical protein